MTIYNSPRTMYIFPNCTCLSIMTIYNAPRTMYMAMYMTMYNSPFAPAYLHDYIQFPSRHVHFLHLHLPIYMNIYIFP